MLVFKNIRKHIYLLVLFCFYNIYFVKSNNKVDTIYHYTFELGKLDKHLKNRFLKHYDLRNNLIEESEQEWNQDNHTWTNVFLRTYLYDFNSNLIEDITKYWSIKNINYSNGLKYNLEYNFDRKVTKRTTYVWHHSFQKYINYLKQTYYYDSLSMGFEEVTENWDTIHNTWLKSIKYQAQYNTCKNKIKELFQIWDTVNYSWLNIGQYDYEFNLFNKNTQTIYQVWDTFKKNWVTISHHNFVYNKNNLVNEFVSKYRNSNVFGGITYFYNLENKSRSNFKYNWRKKIKVQRNQVWDNKEEAWRNETKLIYRYNKNNILVNELIKSYSYSKKKKKKLSNSTKIIYSYNNRDSIILKLIQDFYIDDKNWKISEKYTFEYSANGDLIAKDVYGTWNTEINNFNSHTREEYRRNKT
jgi:hypothetical protein